MSGGTRRRYPFERDTAGPGVSIKNEIFLNRRNVVSDNVKTRRRLGYEHVQFRYNSITSFRT